MCLGLTFTSDSSWPAARVATGARKLPFVVANLAGLALIGLDWWQAC